MEANASRLHSQLAEKESTIENLRRTAEQAESDAAALKEELSNKEEELARVGAELKRGWECLGSHSDSTSGIDSPRSVAGKFTKIATVEESKKHQVTRDKQSATDASTPLIRLLLRFVAAVRNFQTKKI